MPLEMPGLEELDFAALLAEAKRRIPAHTPEWTNFEVESDPGITLVQLFAFLAEGIVYRANRVPERNRTKFLQLLGIPLRPAAAARGLLAVRNERGPLAALVLEPGVAVAAGRIGFVTEDPLTVLPVEGLALVKRALDAADPRRAALEAQHEAVRVAAALASGDPAPSASGVTLRFYETEPMRQPTAADPQPALDLDDPSLLDGAAYLALLAPPNADVALVRAALANRTLSVGVVPALAAELPALRPVALGGAARTPLPQLVFDIPNPSTGGASWRRLEAEAAPDLLGEVGVARLRLPAAAELLPFAFDDPTLEGTGAYPPRLEDEALAPRLVTWLRIRVDRPAGSDGTAAGRGGRLAWIGINAARLRQAVPVVAEDVGTGTGESDQVLRLARVPVLPETLVLQSTVGDGPRIAWRQVEDLLTAAPGEPVFQLDPESGELRFGDGMRGLAAPALARFTASYSQGGGREGNVAIGAINSSADPRLQGGFRLANPVPSWGGDEGETQAEAERQIPAQLRHRDRLVSEQDFHDVTLRTPGADVGRAEVLPLFDPNAPGTARPGAVTVLAIPRFDATRPLWPVPDRLFLGTVCAHLGPRRLITTELHVRGPAYVATYLSLGIRPRRGFAADAVLEAVRARMRAYLSALPPGGPEETGWPLGRALLPQELEAVATRVPGVEFVTGIRLSAGGTTVTEIGFALTGLQLPWLALVEARDGPPEELAALLGTDTPPADPAQQALPVPVTRGCC